MTGKLAEATRATSFSIPVGSVDGAVHRAAVTTAAHVIVTLAQVQPAGDANFRFAAAACVPPGTPFFPVAYHVGADSLAFGVESAGLVRAAFAAVVLGGVWDGARRHTASGECPR
ncbi:MAG TPA: DUF711 family protein [Steroidobacteraceae bacterium]|nr:DUF711 family protein [Steroidobacteraceae bacterium]